MPSKITASYRIVTPMFIGDAHQQASGISPTSVKGALRFWWRALNWGRCLNKINSDVTIPQNDKEAAALRELHAQEVKLFGGLPETVKNEQTGKSETVGGQGAFLLRVAYTHKAANLTPPTSGIQYLLGQGLYHNGYLRSALAEGSIFDVMLSVSTSISEQEQEQLKDALLALGLLGGLGSRSRRGFGSLAIDKLLHDDTSIVIPTDVGALRQQINQWTSSVDLPPFTALSSKTRIDVSLQNAKPLKILETVGTQLQLYRSYGRNGMVNGQQAEQNFISDHDVILKIIRGTNPVDIPKRAIFGLPHNYFFSSEFNRIKREALARGRSEQQAKKEAAANSKLDLTPSLQNNNKIYGSRRASPLFIHIHQFPDKSIVLIQTLMPATFLPQNGRLVFKTSRNDDSVNFDKKMIDWQDIDTYMDRFQPRMSIL
jgi:CRISPR-associated protein Cmr1